MVHHRVRRALNHGASGLAAFYCGASVLLLSSCGEPGAVGSSCEALCDWAVSCHATERSIDEVSTRTACLTAARAVDATCERVERGEAAPAAAQLSRGCSTAVDRAAAAGECGGFVGSIDEIKRSVPPAACVAAGPGTVAAFDAARQSTRETGAALCERTAASLCGRTAECLLSDLGGAVVKKATTVLGDAPQGLCVTALEPVFTADCVAADLYRQEATLDELNPTRQAARECLRDLDTLACDAIASGDPDELPAFCAGAFSSPEDLLDVTTVLFELAEDVAAAAAGL